MNTRSTSSDLERGVTGYGRNVSERYWGTNEYAFQPPIIGGNEYSLERERIDEKDLTEEAMRTRAVTAEASNFIVLTLVQVDNGRSKVSKHYFLSCTSL